LNDVLLAIDGGATHTRCAVFDRSGRVLGAAKRDRRTTCWPHPKSCWGLWPRPRSSALAQANVDRSALALVSAGFAGVDYHGAGSPGIAALIREAGFDRFSIHGDMVIAHRGALAGEPGALASAGTGAVMLGVAADGRMARAGGWGSVFGDEGGGYWIATEGLRAASCAEDGRGPATSLADAIRDRLQLRTFEDVVDRIYGQRMSPSAIGGLSETVAEAAAAGDIVASGILEEAGRRLALGATAVLRRLGGSLRLVSYHGSVLRRCGAVRDSFRRALAEAYPDAVVMPPRSEPLVGAYWLGCRELGWALPLSTAQRRKRHDLSKLHRDPSGNSGEARFRAVGEHSRRRADRGRCRVRRRSGPRLRRRPLPHDRGGGVLPRRRHRPGEPDPRPAPDLPRWGARKHAGRA